MDWIGDPLVSAGVVERRFDVKREDRLIPGLLWTPEGAQGPRPLVLIGHGGTGNKRMPYVLSLARRLIRHQGWAAAAIDGPGHGDRSDPALGMKSWWNLAIAADMTADWTATRHELTQLPEVGDGPLGYWGLSMGTMFGAPFVAATPDVRVAVLGLMGEFGPTDPWVVAAPNITCPVLFLVQLEDELVERSKALALFDALASPDKRLHAHPGPHAAVPGEEVAASEEFLAKHLR